MTQEIDKAKEGFSQAVDHLRTIQPKGEKIQTNHEKAVNIGYQLIVDLESTTKTLLWYLKVVEEMAEGCNQQQQEGKSAQDILSKAGIVADTGGYSGIETAITGVECVSLYAERYNESVIQPVINTLGATGVLGALREMQRVVKLSLAEFEIDPAEEVRDVIVWAIDDCREAQATL